MEIHVPKALHSWREFAREEVYDMQAQYERLQERELSGSSSVLGLGGLLQKDPLQMTPSQLAEAECSLNAALTEMNIIHDIGHTLDQRYARALAEQ
jgi:hypothetical protein